MASIGLIEYLHHLCCYIIIITVHFPVYYMVTAILYTRCHQYNNIILHGTSHQLASQWIIAAFSTFLTRTMYTHASIILMHPLTLTFPYSCIVLVIITKMLALIGGLNDAFLSRAFFHYFCLVAACKCCVHFNNNWTSV